MKMQNGLVVAAVCFAVFISGCQQPAIQTETQDVAVEAKEQPKSPRLPQYRYEANWSERGSVEEIFDVCESVFDELDLMEDALDQRTNIHFDRRARAYCDGLSADISTRTVAGMTLNLQILKQASEGCRLILRATSPTHTEDILEQQCMFLKTKIHESLK